MRIRAVAVLAMVLLSACARDVTAPSDASVAGIYHLALVNGSALPLLIAADSTSRVSVTESVMTLNQDHTWSEVTAFMTKSAADTRTTTQMSFGTYTAMNGAIVLTDAAGFASHGAFRGGMLTILGTDFSLVYRK